MTNRINNREESSDATARIRPKDNNNMMDLRFKVKMASLDNPSSNRRDLSRTSKLTFVNIDHPLQTKSKNTQRKIRRHVMKEIGRSRRRDVDHSSRRDRNIITVSKSLPQSVPSYWGDVKVCINFQRLFWAMDMVSEGLLALAMSDSAYEFRERLDMSLDDTQLQKRPPDEATPLDEMKQYTESISLVRKSIVAPESRVSRHAIIGSIICLAIFDMRVRNHERWTMHMQGLVKVVQLIGGVEALDPFPPVRQSLFLADVLGSMTNDVSPRFPLPRGSYVLPCAAKSNVCCAQKLSVFAQASRLTSSLEATAITVIDSALNSASQLATLLNHVWNANRLTLDLLIPICMLAHDVLSLPRMITRLNPRESTREAISRMIPVCAAAELVRMSVLALLSTVMSTTSGDDLYCIAHRRGDHVRQLLTQCGDKVWAGWAELKLWVLVIQAIIEPGSARLYFVDEIKKVTAPLLLQSWDDLMCCLRQIVWVEKAAIQEMAELKSNIDTHFARRTHT